VSAYYNEIDAKAAAWLRELIRQGLVADGEVDERSIVDVQPGDLRGFTQCHFFAGIGGWSYALRLAGWPDDRAVWTGSCPCQPFSSAGKGAGVADARDLWPAWFLLIRECRPDVVFGEQVESAIGHGWLDRLFDDMEGESYAVGPIGLPAAGVGAFTKRQRLWFVAHDDEGRRPELGASRLHADRQSGNDAARCGAPSNVADAGGRGLRSGRGDFSDESAPHEVTWGAADGGRDMGHATGARPQGLADIRTARSRGEGPTAERAGAVGFWSDAEWIPCRDGKARAVEPGSFPLAHGVPARVGRLRGYGNAIVPQVAAEVIGAYMEIVR
jgi:DNA (cytosine-5)-methyltransferase 1